MRSIDFDTDMAHMTPSMFSRHARPELDEDEETMTGAMHFLDEPDDVIDDYNRDDEDDDDLDDDDEDWDDEYDDDIGDEDDEYDDLDDDDELTLDDIDGDEI